MRHKIKHTFSSVLWQHSAPGGWYFVSMPEDLTKEIRNSLKWQEEGWGRMKVQAQIGTTQWDTAIWFDTKKNTYILSVKAEVRKMQQLETGKIIEVVIRV